MNQTSEPTMSLGQAALVAGIGLLIMAITAPYAEFYVFPKVILPEDIDATLANLIAYRGLYVSGVAAFFLNYVADIIVAWALFIFFAPVNRQLSLLAALFRLLYTALGLSALMNLFSVVRFLDLPQYANQVSSGQMNLQIQLLLDAYSIEWGVALILFGIHLVLVGFLALRSGYVPRFIGYLVAIAGLGYMTYVVGLYVFPATSFVLVTVTFLLEPVFMVWLLWKGRRLVS